MSTEIITIEAGPLTTNHISVQTFACAKSVVDRNLATSRKSVSIRINHPLNLNRDETICLTNNQGRILAEAILAAIGADLP